VGNVARYEDYTKVFGVDGLRYFVMREMTLGLDANFSDEALLTRFNADLATDLGNLISRGTTMLHRYCDGVVPAPGAGEDLDRTLAVESAAVIRDVLGAFDSAQTSNALQRTWELVRLVNQYIVKREPWTLAKDPAKRALLETTLFHAADALRVIAALVEPVMPAAADRIRQMLGVPHEAWTGLAPGTLAPGTRLGPTEALFPRIELTVEELRSMSNPDAVPAPVAPPSALTPAVAEPVPAQATTSAAAITGEGRITIDDFMKVELRVGTVLEAEAVPKSKKLLKLLVNAGTEQRTILAGIAEAYTAEQMVGRTIVFVANLEPRKLMGIESNGMVLAASVEGGLPTLVSVENVPGARVR
jgi:methionyl-tRNA synthetase